MTFRDDVVAAATKGGGSFKTVSDRKRMGKQLCDYLKSKNIQIKALVDLKEKYIHGFINQARAQGISDRTCQNRLSAIRNILRSVDLDRKANALTTEKFGVGNASRNGTRAAMSRRDFEDRIGRVTDMGVAIGLKLQIELGLRQREAIFGGRLDTLSRWEREMTSGSGRIIIGEGTKGGRTRETLVVNKVAALVAIRQAMVIATARGGRLIDTVGLKQALNRYNNQARAAGFTGTHSPHALRYTFAQESVTRYAAVGFSEREAFAFTSKDLGHGDQRGRWVNQVYCRKK